jgi:hypothetical protein
MGFRERKTFRVAVRLLTCDKEKTYNHDFRHSPYAVSSDILSIVPHANCYYALPT